MIGFAGGQVCCWFQVSGVRCQVSVKIESWILIELQLQANTDEGKSPS
jgi:hypothetical protein